MRVGVIGVNSFSEYRIASKELKGTFCFPKLDTLPNDEVYKTYGTITTRKDRK